MSLVYREVYTCRKQAAEAKISSIILLFLFLMSACNQDSSKKMGAGNGEGVLLRAGQTSEVIIIGYLDVHRE